VAKIVLLLVLVAIAIAWVRTRVRDARPPPAAPVQPKAETMVTCAQCGLNLPAGEAVFDAAGTAFCGAPHLEAQRAGRRP
jgi:uncharacterized protein